MLLAKPKQNPERESVKISLVTCQEWTVKIVKHTLIGIATSLNDTLVNDIEIIQRKYKNIEIKGIEPTLQTRVTILIVDRSYSFVAELSDDTKLHSEDAVGLFSYSISRSTVLSYISIFETLWRQSELYKQLQDLYQELALQDNAQRIH